MQFRILSESASTPGTFLDVGLTVDTTSEAATQTAVELTAQDGIRRAIVPHDPIKHEPVPEEELAEFLPEGPNPMQLAAVNVERDAVGLEPVDDIPPPPPADPIAYDILTEFPQGSGMYQSIGKAVTDTPGAATDTAIDLTNLDGMRRALVPPAPPPPSTVMGAAGGQTIRAKADAPAKADPAPKADAPAKPAADPAPDPAPAA